MKRKNEEQLKYEKKLKIDSENRQAHRGKLYTKTIKKKLRFWMIGIKVKMAGLRLALPINARYPE